jgi:hypothetical protein
MGLMPTCTKCGNEHYNFAGCTPRQDKKPTVEWKSNLDSAYGDKLSELKHLGDNHYVQRREYDR